MLETLKKELSRWDKLMALTQEEQARYAQGITKLEKRIEEMREACGVSMADYCRIQHGAIRAAGLNHEEIQRVNLDTLDGHFMALEAAYKAADKPGMIDAAKEMERFLRGYKAQQLRFSVRQGGEPS